MFSGMSFWNGHRQQEVDDLLRRGLVVGAGQDARELDLSIAARCDHARR